MEHPAIIDELVALIRQAGSRLSLPVIERLCIPPPRPEQTKGGEFLAVGLAGGHIGLAYTLLDGALEVLRKDTWTSRTQGCRPDELIATLDLADAAERVLAMGVINAVTRLLFDAAGYRPPPARGSLAGMAIVPGDHFGMVGYFPSLVDEIRARGIRLTVVELDPALVEESRDFRVTLDPAGLAACNKVLCTSTVLLNNSLDEILMHTSRAFVAILGPTAGVLPDPLFQRGIDVVAGVAVEHPAEFWARCAVAEKWGDTARKYRIFRNGYPGFEAILRAAVENTT